MFQHFSKQELSILIGSTLDHFDISLYGFLVPILAPVFFPKYDPIVQLILSYSIVITSLVTRPLGVFIFSNYAKNYGPVLGLSYSLIGVAIATVGMGCIPSYEKIGCIAPVTLILLRMIRSFFASGESTIAKFYIMEGKQQRDALQASYLYQGSAMFGVVLASGAATLVSIFIEIDILWRICFWLGGLVGISGCILRYQAVSPGKIVKRILTPYAISNLKVMWQHKVNISRIAVTTIFSYITYTIPFIFLNSFVPLVTDISLHTMLACNTLFLIIDVLLIFVLGRLLIRFDNKNVMLAASLILACTVIPLLQNLTHASLLYVMCVRFWFVVLGVIFTCPMNYWYKQLFNIPESYFLIGIGNVLGAATLGRMTTAICLYLWYATGTIFCFAVYIMVLAFITAYAIFTVKQEQECYNAVLNV